MAMHGTTAHPPRWFAGGSLCEAIDGNRMKVSFVWQDWLYKSPIGWSSTDLNWNRWFTIVAHPEIGG